MGNPIPLDSTSEVGAVDASPAGTASTCPTCRLDESSSSAASSTSAMPPTLAWGWSVRNRLTEQVGWESDLDSEAEIAELTMQIDLVDDAAASDKQAYPRPSNAI